MSGTNFEITLRGTSWADLSSNAAQVFGSSTITNDPPPVDANVYPLKQGSGPPFTLGVGPDVLQLALDANATHSFSVAIGGKLIALNLVPGAGGGIGYTFQGVFGALPAPGTDFVVFSPGQGAAGGMGGMVLHTVAYNGTPLDWNVPAAASADYSGWGVEKVWDQAGIAIGAGVAPPASSGGPPPSPVSVDPTQVSGATINGTPATAALLSALIGPLTTGETLALPAATIVGTSAISAACTISGAGEGKTVIDATNITGGITEGKGVLVPSVPGITIAGMTIKGASETPDGNGAGVRDGGVGIGFTLRNVEVTGCQNGILTFASNITLDTCYFHNNGNAASVGGATHEAYVNGAPDTTFTTINTSFVCGLGAAHAAHIRSGTINMKGGSCVGNPDASENSAGGAVLDFPNGGVVSLQDMDIYLTAKGAGANTVFVQYGMETGTVGTANLATGNEMTWTNVRLHDGSGTGGVIINNAAAAPTAAGGNGGTPNTKLTLVNCTYDGPTPPTFQGWAPGAITGAFTQASPTVATAPLATSPTPPVLAAA